VAYEGSAETHRRYPPPATGESAWPARLTVICAIAVQLSLPDRLVVGTRWLLPGLEVLLVLALLFFTPGRFEAHHQLRRRAAIGLIALVSFANAFSLYLLAHNLLHHTLPGRLPANGHELIIAGMLIWLTNFLIFGLWYWEIDRGGPGHRGAGEDGPPDFLFPQMSDDSIQPHDWRPRFIDYLYVSLTNATAFSPTDAMPLTPKAKSVMGIQSVISLITIGLIVARAVNIL
jgi:uncharacterized membrane protein